MISIKGKILAASVTGLLLAGTTGSLVMAGEKACGNMNCPNVHREKVCTNNTICPTDRCEEPYAGSNNTFVHNMHHGHRGGHENNFQKYKCGQ